MNEIPPYLIGGGPLDAPPRLSPALALRQLAELLTWRGITRLTGSACDLIGVLSIASGVTAWTNGRVLWWRVNGEETSWPAADAEGAAARLAEQAGHGDRGH